MRLNIEHVTTYTYDVPVELSPHRIILSPRSSHSLHPLSTTLECRPAASIEWTQDVFGNLVATASFAGTTRLLVVINRIVVDQRASEWPILKIAPHAHHYPFEYSDDDRIDLGAFLAPRHADPGDRLSDWAKAVILSPETDTLSLLQDVSAAVRNGIAYERRDAFGTQSPQTTLARGTGSCRDMATMFIEAVRHLGFGARAVSGYLFDPPLSNGSGDDGSRHGATHAWAEVYLPCAGWTAFDPTNGRMGEAHLIPVAVARDIAQLSPIEGCFTGAADALSSMTIDVSVSASTHMKDEHWKPARWSATG